MIWTGIGVVVAFIVGVTVLDEALNTLKMTAELLILMGIIMMLIAN